jgi:long-subunit acyl-CoA synthetase (AMP-forming)
MGRKSFSELIADVQTKGIPAVAVRPAAKNTLAYLVFSSGTTGLPKGSCYSQFDTLSTCHLIFGVAVMISHGNIIYALMQWATMGKQIAQESPVSSILALR